MSEEQWKLVMESEGRYEVSSLGNLRSVRRGGIRRPHRNDRGYLSVSMWIGGKSRSRRINKLVLEAFVGPRPSSVHEAAHLNGVRDDNRLGNLQWKTKQENSDDKAVHGTFPVGERHGLSKLTAADVLQIRAMGSAGIPDSRIAEKFGINRQYAFQIRHFRTWKHLQSA